MPLKLEGLTNRYMTGRWKKLRPETECNWKGKVLIFILGTEWLSDLEKKILELPLLFPKMYALPSPVPSAYVVGEYAREKDMLFHGSLRHCTSFLEGTLSVPIKTWNIGAFWWVHTASRNLLEYGHKYKYTRMFTIKITNWKSSKWPWKRRWLNKLGYLQSSLKPISPVGSNVSKQLLPTWAA